MKKRGISSIKKLSVSVLMVLCMVGGIVCAFPAQTQAGLLDIVDAVAPITRGVLSAVDSAKEENWDFGKAITGTFKAIGKEFMDIDDEDAAGSTVIVNEVDLSEVELELSNIQKALQDQKTTLTQIQSDMNSNMKSISAQLTELSAKIDNKTKQQQYYTYLNSYFEFYNQFYESVAYYDDALNTLYAGNPTQKNIKNTFDQFYELKNVSYTGNFYSAIDRLGKYLRGEYVTTDPGSVVDILCEYYELAGYTEKQTADAVTGFVAQTYYTYCLANYYYLSVALFQDTYIEDGNLVDYTTDFGLQINANQIKKLSSNVLENSEKTTARVFYDLNRHFSSVEKLNVSYEGPADLGLVNRTTDSSKMDVEPNSSVTMPDSDAIFEAYLGKGYSDLFGGMCDYTYTADNTGVTVTGDKISFGDLKEGTEVKVALNCTVGSTSVKLHEYTFTVKKGSFSGGYGTAEYPYVISNTDDFNNFAQGKGITTTDYNFVTLTADLNFSEALCYVVSWNFKGTFYGNGHKISNFETDSDYSNNLGLFTVVDGGRIYDLTIENMRIQDNSSNSANVGGLAGTIKNYSSIVRCELVNSNITNIANAGNVGGLVGYADNSSLTGCIVRGDGDNWIAASSGNVGGLVGKMESQNASQRSKIEYCGRENCCVGYDRNGSTNGGGLVGYANKVEMNYCWSYKTNYSDIIIFGGGHNGVFVGYSINSLYSNIYRYSGSDSTCKDDMADCGYSSGWNVGSTNAPDFTCSKIGLGGVGYLTNATGVSGNPVRLSSDFKISIKTEKVKTSYHYGEAISLNGLEVWLQRGSETIPGYHVPYKYRFGTSDASKITVTISSTSASNQCSYDVTIGAKPHVYVQTLTASTCTEAGSVSYKCRECESTLGDPEVLPARGHMMTHHDAISAACNQVGQKEYWECTTCGKYFLDKDGKTETSQANLVIEGAEHKFGTPAYTWTKTDNGYTCTASVSCANKGCSGHYDTTPLTEKGTVTVKTTAATCTKTGLSVYTATFKNSLFRTQTKNVELAKIPCPSASFTDVNRSLWYHEAIDFAISNGLMKGMSATTFEPDTSVNRAMLVTMLYRLEGEPAVGSSNPFSDVKNDANGSWYYKAVLWASQNKIVNGYEDSTFRPANEITREEMAVMMYRYAQYKKYDVSASASLSGYPDASQVDDWAYDALAWANAEGLITGSKTANGVYILPRDFANRAQIATIFMRFINNIAN